MIHLDTNYLIGLLVKGSAPAADVDGWLAAGQSLAASAMAWTEFLNGPVTPVEVSTDPNDILAKFQVHIAAVSACRIYHSVPC